jgi:tetratricopeptide (TPR) repeat protein
VYYRFGEALVRHGRMAEARENFEYLVELSPDLATGYRGLGQVLLTMGEPESAVRYLMRAAELKPDEEKIFLALARGFTMLDDHARAAEAVRRSKGLTGKRKLPDPVRLDVELRAVDPDACVTRAQTNIAAGRFRQAIPDLKRFEEAAPDHAVAQMLLGLCYRRTGQGELAIEHFRRALVLKDDLVDAHVQLAEMYTARGQRRRAIQHYRRALESQPGNGQIRARLRELEDTG